MLLCECASVMCYGRRHAPVRYCLEVHPISWTHVPQMLSVPSLPWPYGWPTILQGLHGLWTEMTVWGLRWLRSHIWPRIWSDRWSSDRLFHWAFGGDLHQWSLLHRDVSGPPNPLAQEFLQIPVQSVQTSSPHVLPCQVPLCPCMCCEPCVTCDGNLIFYMDSVNTKASRLFRPWSVWRLVQSCRCYNCVALEASMYTTKTCSDSHASTCSVDTNRNTDQLVQAEALAIPNSYCPSHEHKNHPPQTSLPALMAQNICVGHI